MQAIITIIIIIIIIKWDRNITAWGQQKVTWDFEEKDGHPTTRWQKALWQGAALHVTVDGSGRFTFTQVTNNHRIS